MLTRDDGRLAALLAALIALSFPAGAAMAQATASDSTVRTRLVGRTETATVDLTVHGGVAGPDSVLWRNGLPPLSPGTGTRAALRTDLPIRLGEFEVQPGQYRLSIDTPGTLTLAREPLPGSSASDVADVVGRVELSDSTLVPPVLGWSLAIRTQRFGADTLGVREGTTRQGGQVITIELSPATRSWLVLRYRDRELRTPISAR
ncbi:MAG TPA: hypothetical protein PLL69_04595 [Gemmatimonadales bacterium]|nr:hypothetical protein [Gemmatimonadales bacterium]